MTCLRGIMAASSPLESSATSEMPAVPGKDILPALEPAASPPRIEFGVVTHAGRVRKNNEDHFAVVERARSRKILHTSLRPSDVKLPDDHAYVMVVADGLGGGNCGELASELVLRFGWELVSRQPSWLMKFKPEVWPKVQEKLRQFAEEIQLHMREYTKHYKSAAGMGTTWTCGYVVDWHLIVAHVGDTRAYLYRRGALDQLTTDHTMAQKLIEMGLPEQDTTKFRHILTNAFGCDNEHVTIDSSYHELQDGDRLLICSDGLYDMLPNDLIRRELERQANPQEACDVLLNLALEAGGKDNVTMVIADFHAT